jgi:hypothetical protein
MCSSRIPHSYDEIELFYIVRPTLRQSSETSYELNLEEIHCSDGYTGQVAIYQPQTLG